MTSEGPIDVITDNMTSRADGAMTLPALPEITAAKVVLALFLGLGIICVILGNLLVVLSVALFRGMRTLKYALITSLAVADILVAVLVLPISMYVELCDGRWLLGPLLCDFWVTCDVMCCTASILNIASIALDRYWLIAKHVYYTHNDHFPRKNVCVLMMCVAWVASGLIAAAPLLGWRTGSERDKPEQCVISQDYGYTVFSTFGAFWIPLCLIIVTYFHIFRIAKKRVKKLAESKTVLTALGTGNHQLTQNAGASSQSPHRATCRIEEHKNCHGSLKTNGAAAVGVKLPRTHSLCSDCTGSAENASYEKSCCKSHENSSAGGDCVERDCDVTTHAASSRVCVQVEQSAGKTSHTYLSVPNTAVGRAVGAQRRIQSHVNVCNGEHKRACSLEPDSSKHRVSTSNLNTEACAALHDSTDTHSLEHSPSQHKFKVVRRDVTHYLLCTCICQSCCTRRPRSDVRQSSAAPVTSLARSRSLRKNYRTRLRNSARTLGIIIGGFVVCWLPFFVLATVLPFCGETCIDAVPRQVYSVCLWLGYSNSFINPAIYAIWDEKFRSAFKKLLTCGA